MTGNEDPRITGGGERPKSMVHADIYAAFQATRTADTHGLAAGYRQLGNDWATGLHVFSTSIQRSVASSWEGQAADAFVSAINRYTTEAVEFEAQLRALTARIDESAASVETTKYELPEPVEEKHPLHPDSWPVVGSNRDPVIEREQEEAQTIMANKYVTPFVNDYDTQIPVLSSPINPVQPFDIDEPTTGGQVGPGSTSPGDDSSSQQPGGDPSGDDDQTDEDENPDTTEPSDDDAESDPDTSTDDDETTPSSTDPDDTEDTDNTPDSPTTPAGTTPAGTAGGPGGGGTPGSGLPGGGTPGNSPEAARVVPGSPGAVSSVAGATAGSSASGAGRGMSMGGMPMGGARGGQREEDDSHTTPDYLVNQTNTDELIGEEPPTVAGGVIGAHLVPRNRS
ncbi:WXG100 family type VII secretion target [Nocardia sp. NPDC059177]|uniref:WXG100 family type VII secretion target n=1 Tax=Nocardia sp. NPDC059177 TaxID=3346759 RepID=UPI003689A4D0